MRLGLSLVVAILPIVQVPSDACYRCHEGAARHSHPVAVEHRASSGGEFRIPPASMPSGFGSTIANDLLVNGRVECTTCHAVHEQEVDAKFRLRTGDENPTPLCIACHAPER